MKHVNILFLIGFFSSLFFLLLYIVLIDYISFPWRDEVALTDVPLNMVRYGEWESHVNQYVYNPLHGFILIGWICFWGISHSSVCSLSAILAFSSYFILLRIILRRELLSSVVSIVVMTLLYWGGCSFSDIITQGRVDLLALFFMILLINEYIPLKDSGFYSKRKWLSMIYAFLLMGTCVYAIPVLFVFCIVLYIAYKDRYIKRELLYRYYYSFGGIALSYCLMCFFYLLNHSFFRFVNTYISFSATISHDDRGMGLLERIYDAYLTDIYAIVVLAVSVIILIENKAIKNKFLFIYLFFILLIPLMMVLSGRYRSYYSWIFYIPTIVLSAYAIDKLNKKWFSMAILTCVVLSLMIKPILNFQEYTNKRANLYKIEKFVKHCSPYLKEGDNVVFNNSMFYYPLVNLHCCLWQKYQGLQDILQPEEKFKAFIDKKIKNKDRRDKLLDLFNRIEYASPYLPESGYIFTEGGEEYRHTVEFMKCHQYKIWLVTKTNGLALLQFTLRD